MFWCVTVMCLYYNVPLSYPGSLFHVHGKNRLLPGPALPIWSRERELGRALPRSENNINSPGHIPLVKLHHITHLTSKEAEKYSQAVELLPSYNFIIIEYRENRF